MEDTDQFSYSPTRVRALLNLWPQIRAAVEKGTILINPGMYRQDNTEDRLAAQEVGGMAPVPSARRNRPYRIDQAGCLYLDVDSALDKAILPRDRARILAHYYYGYEYSEIAAMEGTTAGSVKVAVSRAIDKMSEWLESPKEAKAEVPLPPRDEGHKRKYTSMPSYPLA